MFIAISPDHPDPLYRQVTDRIRDAIASGELRAGEPLPSIRELAASLDVSVITIKRAYQDLEAEGLIRSRQGLGSFVADVDPRKLRKDKLTELRRELERIVLRSRKFDISPADITGLISEIEGDGHDA